MENDKIKISNTRDKKDEKNFPSHISNLSSAKRKSIHSHSTTQAETEEQLRENELESILIHLGGFRQSERKVFSILNRKI